MKSVSRDEIREIDRLAIEDAGVPGVVLMENAGRNVADAVDQLLGGAAARRVAVVAGAGNNGGDGFVVARHLTIRGARVVTFLLAERKKIAGDAQTNLIILDNLAADVRTVGGPALANLAAQLEEFDLIVDAVGGTGIRGPLRGALAVGVQEINAAGKPVVAVDIPTGLDCDTGLARGPVVRADITVTFVARKKGFDAEGADAYTGKVRVVDIGIPEDVVARLADENAG